MSAITILNAVRQKFMAQESVAVATLELYANNPAGVADHSDVVGEVEKQIKLITEAKECLAVLETILASSNVSVTEQE